MLSEEKESQKESTKEDRFVKLEEQYTKFFAKTVNHESIQSGKVTLLQVLQKKGVTDPEKKIATLRDIIEGRIFSTIDYYAAAQYSYMQRSGDWTEAGQDRVKLGYISILLKIPANKEVSFQHYSEFEKKIREKQEKYNIISLSDKELKFMTDRPRLKILGEFYRHDQTEKINRILEIIGSAKRVICGESGSYKTLIFANSISIKKDKYDIHFFIHEYVRTPNSVQYIVAVIEEQQIAIRHQICRYVFYSKWANIFDEDIFQQELFNATPEIARAEGIKKEVARLFEVDSKQAFEEKIEEFLELMCESLMYHEVAHNLVEELNFSTEEMAMVSGLGTQKETILGVMNEVATEWMPEVNNVCGPFRNIINTDLLKNNRKKAMKMLLMYLSDAWFLDTDTKFMYSYSYIIFTIILKYSEENCEFDLVSMFNEFNDIFAFIVRWYREAISELNRKVKSLKYSDNGVTKNYEDIKGHVDGILSKFEEKTDLSDETDEKKIAMFWTNFFLELQQKDQIVVNEIISFVEDMELGLYEQLMSNFATKEDQEKYGTDIKTYVIEKMQKVGF